MTRSDALARDDLMAWGDMVPWGESPGARDPEPSRPLDPGATGHRDTGTADSLDMEDPRVMDRRSPGTPESQDVEDLPGQLGTGTREVESI